MNERRAAALCQLPHQAPGIGIMKYSMHPASVHAQEESRCSVPRGHNPGCATASPSVCFPSPGGCTCAWTASGQPGNLRRSCNHGSPVSERPQRQVSDQALTGQASVCKESTPAGCKHESCKRTPAGGAQHRLCASVTAVLPWFPANAASRGSVNPGRLEAGFRTCIDPP